MLTSIRALFVFIHLTLLTSCTYFNRNTDDVDEDSNNCDVAQNVPGITNARNKEYRGGHHKAPIHNCLKNIVSNICQNIKNLDERKMRKTKAYISPVFHNTPNVRRCTEKVSYCLMHFFWIKQILILDKNYQNKYKVFKLCFNL